MRLCVARLPSATARRTPESLIGSAPHFPTFRALAWDLWRLRWLVLAATALYGALRLTRYTTVHMAHCVAVYDRWEHVIVGAQVCAPMPYER